nr:MAG TPA: hypothetical protein [Caudoviricetes sp.]
MIYCMCRIAYSTCIKLVMQLSKNCSSLTQWYHFVVTLCSQ